jgi:hypothetical protein
MIEDVVIKSTPKSVSILDALDVRLSLHYQTKSDETNASPQFTVSSLPYGRAKELTGRVWSL